MRNPRNLSHPHVVQALLSPARTSRKSSDASPAELESPGVPPTPISNVVRELEQIQEEFSLIERDIEFEGARVIGDGAGGQVYMARLRASQQVVAVKVMNVGERDPDRLCKRTILDMLQVPA